MLWKWFVLVYTVYDLQLVLFIFFIFSFLSNVNFCCPYVWELSWCHSNTNRIFGLLCLWRSLILDQKETKKDRDGINSISVLSLQFWLVYYSGTLCKKETNKSEALFSRKYLLSEFFSEVTELLDYNKLGKD